MKRRVRWSGLAAVVNTLLLCAPAAGQPRGPLAYASAATGLAIIDTATNGVVGSIPLAELPSFISISPDGTRIYATSESASIAAVDTVQNELLTVITGTPKYTGVAFSPDGNTAYALRYLGDPVSSISIVDTATNEITGDIPLSQDIFARMAVSPDGKTGYVPRSFSLGNALDVTVVDLEHNAVGSPIILPCASASIDLAFANGGRRLYIPVLGGGCLGGGGGAAAAPAGSCTGDCNGDRAVTIDELISGVQLALTGRSAGACARFDPNADDRVSIDELVEGVERAVNRCPGAPPLPDGDFAAIIDTRTNSVFELLDFGSIGSGGAAAAGRAAGVPTGDGLPGLGIEVSPDGRFAYVTSCGDGLCVLDTATQKIVDTVAIPGFPYNIAITPDGRTGYVTDNGDGPITIVDLEQRAVVGTIDLSGALDIVVAH